MAHISTTNTVDPTREPLPTVCTREEVTDALTQAADDVLEAVDAGDEGLCESTTSPSPRPGAAWGSVPGLLPTVKVEVIVVRDPDAANDYAVFVDGQRRPDGKTDRVRVVTHDIDLGAVEITPAWVAGQLQRADGALSPAAAHHARESVTSYADDLEGRDPEVQE
jgi:hypothetical protein